MIKARFLALALLPCFLTACGGAGDPASEGAGLMDEMASVFESIESKDDIEAAKGKLETIGGKLKALKAKVEAMPKEEKDAVEAKLAKSGEEIGERVKKAMTDLAAKDPGVAMQMGALMGVLEGMR